MPAYGSCRSRGRQERAHRSLENHRTVFHELPQAPFPRTKVSPMFPVYSVTDVPGCTVDSGAVVQPPMIKRTHDAMKHTPDDAIPMMGVLYQYRSPSTK